MANIPLHISALIRRDKFIDYRDAIWGESYQWSWERATTEIEYIVIHHTVTMHEATPDDIALLHKARGWVGVGYHFIIDKAGIVYYVGDVGTARANVKNMNEKVIGIALIGDFTKHLPSDEQIQSAHELCQFFIDNSTVWPNIKGWDGVKGHKELQATKCPGNDWKDTVSALFNRIQGNIPYYPVEKPAGEVTVPKPDDLTLADQLLSQVTDLQHKLKGKELQNDGLRAINENLENRVKRNYSLFKAALAKLRTWEEMSGLDLIIRGVGRLASPPVHKHIDKAVTDFMENNHD